MIVFFLFLVAVALGACSLAPAPRAPVTPAPSPAIPAPTPSSARGTACVLEAGPVQPADTLTVALTGPVDPAHAPVPVSDAERLVFAQLYEPLVHVDCVGRVVPGLAESWSVDSGGGRWTFTLRRDAQFWDGAPVTAQDVLAAWHAHDSPLGYDAVVVSPREIGIDFWRPLPDLAGPLYAVTKPSPDHGWSIGTGRYWISGTMTTAAPIIKTVGRGGEATEPVVAFRNEAGSDPRDVLDQGVDLLLTDDPTVVSYAGARPGLAAWPLVWDRRYVLAVQFEPGPAVDRRDLVGAVHAEARADSGTACAPFGAGNATTAQPVLPLRRLVYDRTDRTARELVERLVARRVLGADVPAWGLAPADFAAALRANTAWAYVSVVPTTSTCVSVAGETHVQALIDVRRFAIVRRGLPPLRLDADGALRLVPR